MRKRRKAKSGECVHCGAIGPVTRDHVPPKGLFKTPRPKLETVASCEVCNTGASDDDEYFRATLLMEESAGNHGDAIANRAAFFRSLQRPQAAGFSRMVANNVRQANIVTPSGIYLGRRPVYDVDLERLSRVATRTLRGLFYLKTGHRLPDDYTARATVITDVDMQDANFRQTLGAAAAHPSTVIGANVLEYWVHFLPESPDWSVWLFRYYEAVSFAGLTLPSSLKATT